MGFRSWCLSFGRGASNVCSGFRIKVVENREELRGYVILSGLLSYFFVSVLRPASVFYLGFSVYDEGSCVESTDWCKP